MLKFLVLIGLVFSFAIILFLFCKKFWGLIYPFLFWGAIYVPTKPERVEKMIEFLDIKPGQMIADLGAGDGRLLIAAANKGAKAYGYEINPILVSAARKNIRKAGVEDKALIFCKNLWHQDLRDFDSVVVYGMGHMMGGLEKKFNKELKHGAKVVSNYFVFPKWKPEHHKDKIYFYIKS